MKSFYPNPKDFANFEDFLQAVQEYEQYLESFNAEKSIQHTTPPPGWTDNDDEDEDDTSLDDIEDYIKDFKETSVRSSILDFQSTCNQDFFWGYLPEKDLIIPNEKSEIRNHWADKKLVEYNTLSFAQDVLSDIRYGGIDFKKEESLRVFGQVLYRFVFDIFRYQKIKTKNFRFIEESISKQCQSKHLKNYQNWLERFKKNISKNQTIPQS